MTKGYFVACEDAGDGWACEQSIDTLVAMAHFIAYGVQWPTATTSLRPWRTTLEVIAANIAAFEFVPVDVISDSDHARVLHCRVARGALPTRGVRCATVRQQADQVLLRA